MASLFGDIDAVVKKERFTSEEVFVGTRRVNELKMLYKKKQPLKAKIVLAAKDELENFISASINSETLEEILFKIRPDPVFEGSREAFTKSMREEENER